jgi:hypothetical protein
VTQEIRSRRRFFFRFTELFKTDKGNATRRTLFTRCTHPPMEQIMSGNGSKWLPVRNYDTRDKEGASKSF